MTCFLYPFKKILLIFKSIVTIGATFIHANLIDMLLLLYLHNEWHEKEEHKEPHDLSKSLVSLFDIF